MCDRYRILSCGLDGLLLHDREVALRRAGYEVISELSPNAAIRDLQGSTFDAVLLCYTIPADQTRMVSVAACEICEVPCILLCPNSVTSHNLSALEAEELAWVVELAVRQNISGYEEKDSWS